MIYMYSNNGIHPATKSFTPLHYTCRHFTSFHLNFTQLHHLYIYINHSVYIYIYIYTQSDSGGICNTLGNDTMCDSKQKSSYEHAPNFERLPR
jgi:hypothetical protein